MYMQIISPQPTLLFLVINQEDAQGRAKANLKVNYILYFLTFYYMLFPSVMSPFTGFYHIVDILGRILSILPDIVGDLTGTWVMSCSIRPL